MFGKRKNKKTKAPGEDWKDKAAGKIANVTIRLQTKFAHVMNKLVSTMPQKKLKIILIAFCLISGGFSIYLAANAIFGTTKKQPAIKVNPIHIPRHYDKTGSEINEPDNAIGDDLYREMQEYKHYMDSLGQTIRPGLLDSIKVLEQIYHSQKIK